MPKVTFWLSKCSLQSPKCILLPTKQKQWPGARDGELEVRNETKPYQRDELHPTTAVKIFETEFRKPQIAKRLLRLRNHPRSKDMIFVHLDLFFVSLYAFRIASKRPIYFLAHMDFGFAIYNLFVFHQNTAFLL